MLFAINAIAEPKLYPTGPAEDAAFIRFVTATAEPITVSTEHGAQIKLSNAKPSTAWMQVTPETKLKANISYSGQKKTVVVEAKPSEFITIAVLPSATKGWVIETGHETPQNFDAFKVSLGLMNLAAECKTTSIKLAKKDIPIVSDVSLHDVGRRMINPMALSVDLYCNGKKTGEPISLDHLRAGDRWTLLLYRSNDQLLGLPILDKMP